MSELKWEVRNIIAASKSIDESNEPDGWSSSEQIAAAFVLDRMDLIPDRLSPLEAWDRLGKWKEFVREVKRDHMSKIK